MNVLSVFDGISTLQLAMQRAGVRVDAYYASEIDKYAIKVTRKNFPRTIQLGDITKIKGSDFLHIDLFAGGSPCQGFSNAGKGLNFDDPRSKLFFEYVRILNELRQINPDIKFLLENVKMKKEWRNIITSYLGVEPVMINSSLVSAQNRERYYWTNIKGGIIYPKDKGIKLKDIIQNVNDIDPSFILSEREMAYMNREVKGGRTHWDFMHHSDSANDKSACVVSNFSKGVPYNVLVDREKSFCITSSIGRTTLREYFYKNQGGLAFVKQPDKVGLECTDGKIKIECIVNGEDKSDTFNTILPDGYYVARKFTPIECERLQTLPDNYTAGISNTQRYKCIGNGWTTDVIVGIVSPLAQKQTIRKAV